MDIGILEYWNTGILEYWNTGILEYWNTGILECCDKLKVILAFFLTFQFHSIFLSSGQI